MALITAAQRSELIALTVGMFNAAPGQMYLNDLVVAREAGMTNLQIANVLDDTAAFKTVYPPLQTALEFATSLMNNLLGTEVALVDKNWAIDWAAGQLNGGASKAAVIVNAVTALLTTTNPAFADARAAFENKVEVAEYYSVTKGYSDSDLVDLQEVIAGVTSDDTTVDDAIDVIDESNPNGQIFTLKAGADVVKGAVGNDTINALTVTDSGDGATTLSAFDNIDGGSGIDTLNIFADFDNGYNEELPSSATIKNVEIINIFNSDGAFETSDGGLDASEFEGATQIWQDSAATYVYELESTTTAGFRNIGEDVEVGAADEATSVTIALDSFGENNDIYVYGEALESVAISGSLEDTDDSGSASPIWLDIDAGDGVETFMLTTAVGTKLGLWNTSATKDITTLDASASTGAITFAGIVNDDVVANSLAMIKTGTGKDTLTIATATLIDDAATTNIVETLSAMLDSGAGDDTLTIATTGTGATTVNAGDGKDSVTLTTDGDGVLTVNLGAGNDTFKGAGSVSGTDVVDGGDGTDTLLLNMVGVANIGAFSNFETFDAIALAKTLDLDILASKNTVTEIITTGDVGAAAILTNVGAGVGFRVTKDAGIVNALTLTQKTAGLQTITLDIDESAITALGTITANTDREASVTASNATSIKAVFDSSFVDAAAAVGDNVTDLNILGSKATALEIVSGGANALNDLEYSVGPASAPNTTNGLLTAVTISGASALDLDLILTGTAVNARVATLNASTMTGALTFNTVDMLNETAANTFNGGLVTLGSGSDIITVTQGANIAGFAKGTIEDAEGQGLFDVISTGGAVTQTVDVAATATHTVLNGKFTFNGTGPATLADAIALVDSVVLVAGEAAVFEYIGNSYIFVDGGPVVKLTGVTGLAGLDEVGTSDTLYVF